MLVSVVIPVYNREDCILQAAKSVLAQTYHDLEVLIVDDGSTDSTWDVIGSIDDERIKCLRNCRNKGAQGARNTGILAARGEYIAFLDSDDVWFSGKLEAQLRFMLDADCDFSATLFYKLIGGVRQPYKHRMHDILYENYIGTFSTVVIRSALVERIGLLDESLRSCQDWDYWIRASRFAKINVLGDYLVDYFVGDGGNISKDVSAVELGMLRVLKKHITPSQDKGAIAHNYYRLFCVVPSVGRRLSYLAMSLWAAPSYIIRRAWKRMF